MKTTALINIFACSGAGAFTPQNVFTSRLQASAVSTSSIYEKAPRHDTGNSGVSIEIDPAEAKVQQMFAEHQKSSPQLNFAESVRTLVEYNHGFGVISTNSKQKEGYPSGGVIGFVPDEDGNPLFLASGLAVHTQDILVNPKCSFTVASKDFKGNADARVNLMGTAVKLPKEDIESAKTLYRKKHPDAFWVEFGDFTWFKIDVEKIHYVGGFGKIGGVPIKEYNEAKPDEISEVGGFIASHMNDDHMDANIAMVENAVPGISPTEAIITSVDSLGMFIKVTRSPAGSDQVQQFKMRLGFPRRAEDRKDVKTLIVEMTSVSAPTSD